MKNIIVLFSLLGSISLNSQYTITSFVVLNDDMEESYLELESVWKEYHQESIEMGRKNFWFIWEVDPSNFEDKIEKDRIPQYMIAEGYSNKEQLEAEMARYNSQESYGEMKKIMIERLSGKLSEEAIENILSKAVRKETRMYTHETLAKTPMTGGDLKPGDNMVMAPMRQLQDDYEQYEVEFYRNIFAQNVMDGNHRYWEFTKTIDKNENALDIATHSAWNLFMPDKDLNMPQDFASQKIMEITPDAREMYNPITFTLIYTAK